MADAFVPSPIVNHRHCRTKKPNNCHRRPPLVCQDSSLNGEGNSPLAIEARHVNFTWPNGRNALLDVTLDVQPGQLAMIVGRNGCGKSTLLSILRGVIFADEGTVHVDSPCAYIRQDPDLQILFPTIGDDIAFMVPDHDKKTKSQVVHEAHEALEYVGLTPTSYFFEQSPNHLSGGQKQRAVLAAALVTEPRTILFDEVTASIDPLNRADLLQRVRRIVTERNIAAIWVTHVLDELDAADTIIIMEGGSVVKMGPRVLMMPDIYELEDSIKVT